MKKRIREEFKTDPNTKRLLHCGKGINRDKKRERLGALGEPGRFTVVGRGMRTGVRHFSV